MNVNHGRAHILVPQKLLNRADVVAILKQTGSERVAQGVRTGWLRDTSLKPRVFDGFLKDAKFGEEGKIGWKMILAKAQRTPSSEKVKVVLLNILSVRISG